VTRENGEEMTMDARLDYLSSPLALKIVKHINSAGAVLHDSARMNVIIRQPAGDYQPGQFG